MRVFNFLGSLYFAIALIATTLLCVILGTVLESWSGSHLFAASLTYHNPFFQLLLWLYFINILFSALHRFPFQKKQIPFLLTHLGLLLLLSGVFVKNHYGVQGTCALMEGSASDHIFLPQSYALHVETPKNIFLIPCHQKRVGPLPSGDEALEITLLEWRPHVEEHIDSFIKGRWGHILGLPPFELKAAGTPPSLQTADYQIYAYDQESSLTFPGKASLFFFHDREKRERLVAFNDAGERFEHSLGTEAFLIYNKGYGGYASFVDLPPHFPPLELIAPLTRRWKLAPLPQKREEATPRITLLAKSGETTEMIALTYDQYAQHFKWPILGGQFLVRFQAMRQKIPFSIRLLSAKKINYPGTQQPYSYEATIAVEEEERRLSMNHVYEKKGYRFYLANLIESETGANRVQIVVNYDPAKYWLTYPGALLLAMGIVLLYLSGFKTRNLGYAKTSGLND